MRPSLTTVGGDAPEVRALIVDDNPANVLLLEKTLSSLPGLRTTSTTDPLRALTLFRECPPDIVLLDLRMAPLDGLALMDQLRAHMAPTDYLPVVILTADRSRDARNSALERGASDFLTKPFDPVEVTLRVSNLLRLRALHEIVERDRARAEEQLRLYEVQRGLERSRLADAGRAVADVISGDRFSLVYQPIVSTTTGETMGYEALTRFATPDGRDVARWFHLAHEAGRGAELELASVSRALGVLDLVPSHQVLSVNLSPRVLREPEVVAHLACYDGTRVVIELTEHDEVLDLGPLAEAVAELRRAGFGFAVDDTGSGYSGLSRILKIAPQWIKLDLDITRGVDSDAARRAMAKSLAYFAGEIGAVTISEGVETAGELEAVRDAGIDFCQGFHLARPGPLPVDVPVGRVRAAKGRP